MKSMRLRFPPLFMLALAGSLCADAILPGEVRDHRSDKLLPRARICVLELDICTQTDTNGVFRLEKARPGLFTITAQLPGFDTLMLYSIQVKSGLNDGLVLRLRKASQIHELAKVRVTARKLRRKKLTQFNSTANLDHYTLNNTAGTANDISRVLETMPSTVMGLGKDFDNSLYVRGGQSTENVFLVDGIELDNVSHFGGLGQSGGPIGFINTELVQDLDFYVGSVPVNFPARLSSVIDINMREGSFAERKHQVDLNASGLSLLTEGPLGLSRSSYVLNARAVDLRVLKPFLTSVEGIPRWGDGFAKLAFRSNNRNRFSLTSQLAYNTYWEEDHNWGGTTRWEEDLLQTGTGFQWKRFFEKASNTVKVTFTSRSDSRGQTFVSRPDTNRDSTWITVNNDSTLAWRGTWWFPGDTIEDSRDFRRIVSVRNALSLFVRDNDRIDLGVEGKYAHFEFAQDGGIASRGWYLRTEDNSLDTIRYDFEPYGTDFDTGTFQISGHAQYVLSGSRLKAIAGLRGDYYTLLEDAVLSPRAAVSSPFEGVGTFSLSGGLYHQLPGRLNEYLSHILNPDPNLDIRYLVSSLELQRNWQTVLGYERYFRDTWLLTAEAYLKWYDREYPLQEPGRASFDAETTNVGGVDEINLKPPEGKKKVYGAELLFQKKKYDHFYYSLAYSLFFAENEYAREYAGKTWFTDEFNVRNSLSLVLGSNWAGNHGLSLRLAASEGMPHSKQEIVQSEYGYHEPLYDSTVGYYTERFDPLVSTNLRYSFKSFRSWGNITGYIELMNALNYKPVIGRYFAGDHFRHQYQNGIIPVAGMTVDF